MKILVTFAVEAEFAPWRKLRRFSSIADAAVPSYSAAMDDLNVVVLLTGVGGRKAWAEATKIIWESGVDVCISSGLAGGLRNQHRPGDVLAARKVHATNWEKIIPGDNSLLELATTGGAKLVDAFYTADRVLVHSAEKRELGAKADAVEMESGDVLLEAVAFGAKVIAIRAISDAVEENLPLNFNRVTTENGNVSIGRVIMEAARHPASVPALFRFGQQSRRATERLALFLESYIQRLASSQLGKTLQKASV